MKKILILVLLTLSISCSNTDKIPEELSCETQDLGIDEMSKFSQIVYTPSGGIHQEWSNRWLWKIENDTIEISGNTFTQYNTKHFLFKKNNDNCLDFLFARNIEFDDNIILDNVTNQVISGGYYWDTYYNLEFSIQEYVEDERLVCKVGNTSIWIDFTLDIKNEEWQFEPSNY